MLFIPGFNVTQPSRKRTIFDVWCSAPTRSSRYPSIRGDGVISNQVAPLADYGEGSAFRFKILLVVSATLPAARKPQPP